MRFSMYQIKSITAGFVTCLALSAPVVFSGGFQLWEEDLTGFGDVHAGDAASTESAGAQFYNPAVMSAFTETAFSVGAVGVILDTQVEPGSAVGGGTIDEPVSGDTQNAAPNFSVVVPLSEQWAIGFSESSPFGLSSDYSRGVPSDSRETITTYATDTTIETINLNPNLSYRLSPHWSLGAGVDVMYATANYDSSLLTNQLDDWGYGYNLGIYYAPSEIWHFGLSYRSKIDLTLSGDSTADGLPTTQASADLPMPATTYFSATQKVSKKWNLLYSIFYSQWDVIDTLSLEDSVVGDIDVPQNYKNTWFFSLGTTYQMTDRWLFRGGVGYDQTPTRDGNRDARMPDSDRYLIGVGAGLKASKRVAIDVGYQHVFMHDADLDETIQLDGSDFMQMTGTSSSSADLFGIQFSYRLA